MPLHITMVASSVKLCYSRIKLKQRIGSGEMTVTQDHCSSYAIMLYGTLDIPKTGGSASNLLGWLLIGIAVAGILTLVDRGAIKKVAQRTAKP